MNIAVLPTESRIALYVLGLLVIAVLFSFVWILLFIIKYAKHVRTEDEKLPLFADVAYFYEKGKRERQEDSVYISSLDKYTTNGILACVSDGMGGLKYGKEISKSIVDDLDKIFPFPFNDVENTVSKITRISTEIFRRYGRRGGATLALVHIFKDRMHIYSVGDSNIILVRNDRATVLNQKQNYYNILVKDLANCGLTTEEAYLNKKSRALTDFMGNVNTRVMNTNVPFNLLPGDTIIICSDGVTDAIPYDKLPIYVGLNAKRTADEIKLNIRQKNLSKQDNYSCIVVKLDRYNF
ncbi:MAG: protein phosphatase 2C domain-containing protein [Clostridia bacterium]|nr:protein phosphatase 2C domain-containing protein [Clostridia bacterium]